MPYKGCKEILQVDNDSISFHQILSTIVTLGQDIGDQKCHTKTRLNGEIPLIVSSPLIPAPMYILLKCTFLVVLYILLCYMHYTMLLCILVIIMI